MGQRDKVLAYIVFKMGNIQMCFVFCNIFTFYICISFNLDLIILGGVLCPIVPILKTLLTKGELFIFLKKSTTIRKNGTNFFKKFMTKNVVFVFVLALPLIKVL